MEVKKDAQPNHGNYYHKWIKSGKHKFNPTDDDIKCELQLSAIGSMELLDFKINLNLLKTELQHFDGKWAPYLQREGRVNPREGLCLVGLEGDSYNDSLSMPEAKIRTGRKLTECDFSAPTEAYHKLTALHDLLDWWKPLGRTMLVKTHMGGYFPPHRDQPILTRDTFRVVAFLNNVDHKGYEWEMEGRRIPITAGDVYYIDTRKTHRTHSWQHDSIHLIMNIPKTWENTLKLISKTLHK